MPVHLAADPATIYRHKRDVHGYKPVPRKTKKQAPTKKTRDRRTRVASPASSYDEEEETENVAPTASSFSDIDTWSSRAISESPSTDPNTPTIFGAVNLNASSFLFANPYSAASSSSSSDELRSAAVARQLQWETQVPAYERSNAELGEREEPVRPSSPLPFLRYRPPCLEITWPIQRY
ncbi:hypothetical protein A0H81_06808 [Grifola frondosa]|uniref:Uncharacterized protein n=1 Tax=Grifola frondosa TaxID=5627 RepID=A0A1C7M8M0_GRIFR|nr:hypothetical protein A0H81_06808 [Grifola frondosa]